MVRALSLSNPGGKEIKMTMMDKVHAAKKAVLYRMVMPSHTCPWGLKALHLLKSQGFEVEDHHLKTREETDAFMAKHKVKTTPQIFINGQRIGGYDDLRRFFAKPVREPGATS
jgi:glutaredoxin